MSSSKAIDSIIDEVRTQILLGNLKWELSKNLSVSDLIEDRHYVTELPSGSVLGSKMSFMPKYLMLVLIPPDSASVSSVVIHLQGDLAKELGQIIQHQCA